MPYPCSAPSEIASSTRSSSVPGRRSEVNDMACLLFHLGENLVRDHVALQGGPPRANPWVRLAHALLCKSECLRCPRRRPKIDRPTTAAGSAARCSSESPSSSCSL